jgi:UDP-glucose 4-epimerase
MRAIVTGGAGFIGSTLVDALVERGDEVVAVDDLSNGKRENVHPAARLEVLDVRDAAALDRVFDEVSPDVCFHLAAQADVRVSVDRPDFDCEVNVLGTIRVLEAARRTGARVVFTSTGGAIYGECDRPAGEDAPLRPLAPYGASKLCGEAYLGTYDRLYGGGHTALRLGNVFGPRQDPHGEAGVVAIFFGLLAAGGEPKVFGDGSQTRDYVFVGDVVRAALAAVSGPAGVYNVGTGRETSVLELLATCCRVAGVEREPVFAPPRPGELHRSVLDPSLAARELGVEPETSLEDGLRATWEWVLGKEGA